VIESVAHIASDSAAIRSVSPMDTAGERVPAPMRRLFPRNRPARSLLHRSSMTYSRLALGILGVALMIVGGSLTIVG
jgi:hypothetical protein